MLEYPLLYQIFIFSWGPSSLVESPNPEWFTSSHKHKKWWEKNKTLNILHLQMFSKERKIRKTKHTEENVMKILGGKQEFQSADL